MKPKKLNNGYSWVQSQQPRKLKPMMLISVDKPAFFSPQRPITKHNVIIKEPESMKTKIAAERLPPLLLSNQVDKRSGQLHTPANRDSIADHANHRH